MHILLPFMIYSHGYNAFRIGLLSALIIDILDSYLVESGKYLK